MEKGLNLRIRPSYSDDSFGDTLPLPSQFLALSAHSPKCHIEHNVLKNALCFIMWYLVAMAIRVMLLLLMRFFIWYIVQVKSMCVPILRSIGSELTKLENMQKNVCFNWCHVTQKRYVVRHGDYNTSDRYFDKEHFETNQKSLRLPVQKLWLK